MCACLWGCECVQPAGGGRACPSHALNACPPPFPPLPPFPLTNSTQHARAPPQLITNYTLGGGEDGNGSADGSGGGVGSGMGVLEASQAYWNRGCAYDKLGYTLEAIAGEEVVGRGA